MALVYLKSSYVFQVLSIPLFFRMFSYTRSLISLIWWRHTCMLHERFCARKVVVNCDKWFWTTHINVKARWLAHVIFIPTPVVFLHCWIPSHRSFLTNFVPSPNYLRQPILSKTKIRLVIHLATNFSLFYAYRCRFLCPFLWFGIIFFMDTLFKDIEQSGHRAICTSSRPNVSDLQY